ncbi:hypothetical protein IW261DRAFT_1483321 [Armillaria novae-zelandiae]|uniref:Uncharacterized protein n=1 Tax=Armillaria novae-zelandiae TaxID=153914 RepID=A0AA39P6B3_9AGAR|nr:hypothetical protein IW261DRAFT_1483321 [Armillaria novae-zelandiae]
MVPDNLLKSLAPSNQRSWHKLVLWYKGFTVHRLTVTGSLKGSVKVPFDEWYGSYPDLGPFSSAIFVAGPVVSQSLPLLLNTIGQVSSRSLHGGQVLCDEVNAPKQYPPGPPMKRLDISLFDALLRVPLVKHIFWQHLNKIEHADLDIPSQNRPPSPFGFESLNVYNGRPDFSGQRTVVCPLLLAVRRALPVHVDQLFDYPHTRR